MGYMILQTLRVSLLLFLLSSSLFPRDEKSSMSGNSDLCTYFRSLLVSLPFF